MFRKKYGVFTVLRANYSTQPVDFFSRKPLNHETFSRRLDQFYKQYPTGMQIDEELFLNFIKANRLLQRQNTKINSKFGLNVNQKGRRADFLDIKAFSNTDLESKVQEMFNKYNDQTYIKNNLVKYYLLAGPGPSNTHSLIETVRENFQRNLTLGKVSKSVVQSTLNVLLAKKDYYNGFKLVDLTYSSEPYLRFCERNNKRSLRNILLSCTALTLGECLVFPFVPLFALAIFNFGVLLCLCWYMMKINLVNNLGRISWRSYNNFIYNKRHQDEILSINKIITHFEEHNEINIKNFHHSKVRQISNLNIVHLNDYIIELPNSNGLLQVNDRRSSEQDSEIFKLQAFFRKEIRKRKMVLNDIQEELMFLEFWYTHGENFEWVEPDQDPAEIIRLKINNQHSDI